MLLLYDLSVHLSFSLRLLFLFASLYPSLDGVFELLCESMFSCRCSPFMISYKSEIVCFSSEMVAVCLLFCSIIHENMVIIILIMVDNESTSKDKSAGALSFSSLQRFSASCFNSLKSI